MKRQCGILLPVSSLPSRYGIGAFSREAYRFVDRLKEAGQQYWQILPLGPTGYGDSPYQSFSAFAGNPYFIDLEQLVREKLLTRAECNRADFGQDPGDIDYGKLYENRFPLLRKAYERWKVQQTGAGAPEAMEMLEAGAGGPEAMEMPEAGAGAPEAMEMPEAGAGGPEAGKTPECRAAVRETLGEETREYCFYMAVKNHFGGKSWELWDEDIRLRQPEAVERYQKELSDEIRFYEFQQIKFEEQWRKLKAYANDRGIRIIGDIPIYVAFDGADTWSHPELFQFDREGKPEGVAGCPPDAFSATGQLWGNPLYRWDYHRKTGFAWWLKRMEYSYRMYDVVRVDHFRGFDEYYSIPYGDATAEFGHWEKGPGLELFQVMKKKLGELDIIAEDLGFLTPSVLELVKDTGFPGMKVLEFAFDDTRSSAYLTHKYPENCVVYTGTHDNQTLKGWYETLDPAGKQFSVDYLGNRWTPVEEIHWDFIRLALRSVARLAVIPFQDYLGLGDEARINEPSTLGKNWRWRMDKDAFTPELAAQCRKLACWYGRCEPEKPARRRGKKKTGK